MSQATERREYVTYAPDGSRCSRCGFRIKTMELAERSLESSAPGTPLKAIYRHAQFKDCKKA